MANQYWPLDITRQDAGFSLELRANVALKLIEHFGAIAAVEAGEDSKGRHRVRLQSPTELVHRCYAIADAFVDMAESRNELRGLAITEEEAAEKAGQMARIRSRAEYPTADMPGLQQSADSEEMRQMRARHVQERRDLLAKQGELKK